eukprot:908131_1
MGTEQSAYVHSLSQLCCNDEYDSQVSNSSYHSIKSKHKFVPTDKLLVDGYIHKLNKRRYHKCSSDIIRLCFEYYKNPITLLINFEKNILIMTPHRNHHPYIPQVVQLQLPSNTSDFQYHISPLCHIPNISCNITIPNTYSTKSHDAIVTVVQINPNTNPNNKWITFSGPTAALYLFESNTINTANINPIYIQSEKLTILNRYVIGGTLYRYGSFINCGSHGVIWDLNA